MYFALSTIQEVFDYKSEWRVVHQISVTKKVLIIEKFNIEKALSQIKGTTPRSSD